MTHGEKIVGKNFNPSGNPLVDELKTMYAHIIDVCHEAQPNGPTQQWLWKEAVEKALTAQMWAVKAATWVEPETKHGS